MANKLLYPRNTATRQVVDLSGMWKFCFDKASDGEKKGYVNGLPAAAPDMPVPASFADFFTDKYSKAVGSQKSSLISIILFIG